MGKCYLLHIGYNGEKFSGWQLQPELRTVQGTLYDLLRAEFPNGKIGVFAASRTDSGVHALGQTCKLNLPCRLGPQDLRRLINKNLPADCTVFDCRRIAPSFKVTDYVVKKEYYYFFSNKLFEKYHFVADIEEKLDLPLLNRASKIFEGKHSFHNYQHRSQVKGGFVREIFNCEVIKASKLHKNFSDDIFVLKITGSGFLKQMVRIIAGTIFNFSAGKINEEQIRDSFKIGHQVKVGFIAPAKGLVLHLIEYPDWETKNYPPVKDYQYWKKILKY